MTQLEHLERLSDLLDEGKISPVEFESLKRQMMDESSRAPEDSVEDLSSTQSPTLSPAMERHRTPRLYATAFGLGIASVFLGGTFGLLAWLTVAVGGWALFSLKVTHRRWMAWTGVALGLVFSFVNVYLNGHLEGLFEGEPVPIEPTIPVQLDLSFGFSVDEVTTRWNDLVIPPYLSGDPEITDFEDVDFDYFKFPAAGPYAYGFFDRSDRKVFILGIATHLVNENTDVMLGHLCWTISPAQASDCQDAFNVNAGMWPYSGMKVNDIPDVSSNWNFQGHAWQLEYDSSDGVLDIMVTSLADSD